MTVDAKIAAFEALVTEVSTAVAELVEAAQKKNASADEIAATLAEMLEVMRAKPDPAEATAGLQAIRHDAPAVHVENKIEVKPTPIENIVHVAPAAVQILDRHTPTDYELKVKYDGQGRIETARMVAMPRKAAA